MLCSVPYAWLSLKLLSSRSKLIIDNIIYYENKGFLLNWYKRPFIVSVAHTYRFAFEFILQRAISIFINPISILSFAIAKFDNTARKENVYIVVLPWRTFFQYICVLEPHSIFFFFTRTSFPIYISFHCPTFHSFYISLIFPNKYYLTFIFSVRHKPPHPQPPFFSSGISPSFRFP